jgi:ArsR family metal-binding transcriptional regulator
VAFLDGLTLIRTVPCLAEPGKIVVVARTTRTLDGVLPLIAAVAPNIISFNPEAGTLTLRRQLGFITLYPDQVMLSQVKTPKKGKRCWQHSVIWSINIGSSGTGFNL